MPETPYGDNNPNVPPETLVIPPVYTVYGQQQSNQPTPFSGYTYSTPPPPPPYTPNPSNPYDDRSWARTEISGGHHTPIPPSNQLSHPELQRPSYLSPELKNTNSQLKILLITVAVLIVLGAVGGGIFVYTLTRPQPFISLNSQYEINMTPAGSTSTTFRIGGHKFSKSSPITFLLDNTVVPGNPAAQSDQNGDVTTTLTVTSDWPLGNHMLIAKDGSGYMTKDGVALKIVPQGQAHTPGPNNAPPDDTTFKINATYLIAEEVSHQIELDISGNSDPKGGSVCAPWANGSQSSQTGQDDIGSYTDKYSFTCTGTYQGGKLSFSEILNSDTYTYTNGVNCTEHAPYVFVHLVGTFTNATSIGGSYSRNDSGPYDCTQGASLSYFAEQGNWTGQVQQ